MADVLVRVGENRHIRFRDMGDGTVAEVVYVEGGAGEGSIAVGAPTDPAWNGTDPSASLISIMKACHAQLVIIAQNTGL